MKCGSAVQRYLASHEVGCCSLLAGTSFIVFMTLLPLIIDPSVLTFVLDLEPAACLTVHSAALNGTSNCTWTSCQQGCTVDIYKCWHVNVSYLLADPALAAERLLPDPFVSFSSSSSSSASLEPYPSMAIQQPARLYPNVVGCGYPPDVDCDQFFRDYSRTDAFERTFPCYVSMTDPSVAVVHVDRFQAACHLAIGFAPLLLCLVLSVYVSLRLRCQRRSQLTARAAGLISAAALAEEQARRIIESKRRLESRKQSWLNSFRQDRVTSSTSVAYSPTSSSPSSASSTRGFEAAAAAQFPAISDEYGAVAGPSPDPAIVVSVRRKQGLQLQLHRSDFQQHGQPPLRRKATVDDGGTSSSAGQSPSSSSAIPQASGELSGPVIACISSALLPHSVQPHHYAALPLDSPEET